MSESFLTFIEGDRTFRLLGILSSRKMWAIALNLKPSHPLPFKPIAHP
ncbi:MULTISPECIES: hypothetical protein [Kamptonema]|nr:MULTISPECIES: hypothetical protein [Kamptonema]